MSEVTSSSNVCTAIYKVDIGVCLDEGCGVDSIFPNHYPPSPPPPPISWTTYHGSLGFPQRSGACNIVSDCFMRTLLIHSVYYFILHSVGFIVGWLPE